MRELLTEHGHLAYLIVLVWTFFEGETIVLIAGALAQGGYFHPELIAISAWIGSMCGDQTWFQLGRRFGRPWLAKRPHWAARTARISRLLERNATLFILSFRFFYGLRNISPIVIAVSGISVWRFTILNFIAAGIWAHTFTYGGYIFGNAVMRMVEHLHYASFGIVVVAIAAIWFFLFRQRKRRRAEEAVEAAALLEAQKAEAQRVADETQR